MKGGRTGKEEARGMARRIAQAQACWTELWHGAGADAAREPLLALAQEEHRRNFELWHEEDKARAPRATAEQLAQVKRNIDGLNQQRNDLIERLDDCIREELAARKVRVRRGARWNSETPGSIVDRLSILSLRTCHMAEQCEREDGGAEHVRRCRARLAVLARQRRDLLRALEELLADLFTGRKQMKVYRQFKMYNDPSLNPAIYGAQKRGQ